MSYIEDMICNISCVHLQMPLKVSAFLSKAWCISFGLYNFR